MSGVGETGFAAIRDIINRTDPRPAVAKTIQDLNKDIDKIDKEMATAKGEELKKLAKLKEKIQDVVAQLGGQEDPGMAADLLRQIVKADPESAKLLGPQILKFDQASDQIRRLLAQTTNSTSGGLVV